MAPKVDFIEVQLNLEPQSSAYVVDLKLPTTVAPGRGARRAKAQAASSNGGGSSITGDQFRRSRTCASVSSIFRRSGSSHDNQQTKKYPRSLLWRVVEDDTVLSIRSADVVKPNSAQPASLVLNLEFPHAVRPACIALHDSPEHDAVHIFALDTANQLYNIVLRAESFRKRSVAEGAVGEWCKVHVPNALNNFKQPYRLIAVSNDQLITTLADGGLIRLDRNKTSGTYEAIYRGGGGSRGVLLTALCRGAGLEGDFLQREGLGPQLSHDIITGW